MLFEHYFAARMSFTEACSAVLVVQCMVVIGAQITEKITDLRYIKLNGNEGNPSLPIIRMYDYYEVSISGRIVAEPRLYV